MRKINIKRNLIQMGNDIVITVQNENGHIGSVVVGQPYEKNGTIHVTTSSFNVLSHKEEVIAKMYAEACVKKYNCVVTCICGIHLDDITSEEMEEVFQVVKEDIDSLIHE